MRSTAGCSGSPTRSSSSRRPTSSSRPRTGRGCSSAASSTRHRNTPVQGERPGMGYSATFGLLADAVSSAETFINVFVTLYGLVIFVYILTGSLRLPYSPTLTRMRPSLSAAGEPYLRLFRRLLPSTGAIDFSPILAFIALGVIDRL